MARIDRVLLACLGVGLVLAVLNGVRGVEARARARPETLGEPAVEARASDPPQPATDDLRQFREALDRLRHNDDGVLPSMRDLARRLCQAHGRCEGQKLVEYYARLTPDQRATGLAEEARFKAVWQRITDAESAADRKRWPNDREEMLAELEELVRPNSFEGDCTPSARALSLAARLEVDRVERDADLASDEREDVLASAEEKARRSIELFERAGMLGPQLEPKWLLGRLEVAREEHVAARRIFEDCLRLARHVGNDEFAEHALHGLVVLAQASGDLDEVARLVDEMAQFRDPGESWPLVRAQASLLLERDQAELAAELLMRQPPTSAADQAEWHLLLGSAWLRSGKREAALEQYSARADGATGSDLRLALASLKLRSGDAWSAVKELEDLELAKGLAPRVHMNAEALRGEAFTRLGQFEAAIPHLLAALEIAGDVQVRWESQQAPDDGAVSVIGEGVGLHTLTLLADAYVRTDRMLAAAAVIETYQTSALHHEIARAKSPDHAYADEVVRDTDVLEWARSFEHGLLTWVIGADSAVVAYVAPDGRATAAAIPRGRRSIDEAVRRLREAALSNDDELLQRLIPEIRSELIPEDILRQITKSCEIAPGRLLFLLHGPLERLPIELFTLEENVFAKRCIPVVLPGLPERAPGAVTKSPRELRWSILGSPIDAGGVLLLPGADHELAEVARLHDDAALSVGADFDRRALSRALASTDAIHIATHLKPGCGTQNGRLADVGLELSRADSFCAREVLDAHPALSLVVIDACETALGRFVDAEGLQGISRAFLESGTRNMIVTLWPVEDDVAREFAIELHRSILNGESPSRAAATARLKLRSAGGKPADWAAFRAVGRD